MEAIGHEVRLVAPIYGKPFVKKHENDATDAKVIVEATLRPTMRFVEAKSADAQARAMLFRTHEQLIRQRTEAMNALRGDLAKFEFVAPAGIANAPRLARLIECAGDELPAFARNMALAHLERINELTASIERMMAKIKVVNADSETARLARTSGSRDFTLSLRSS